MPPRGRFVRWLGHSGAAELPRPILLVIAAWYSSGGTLGPWLTFAVEVTLEFEEAPGTKLADAVKNLLSRFSHKSGADAAQFADISEAVEALAGHVVVANDNYADAVTRLEKNETALKATQDELAAFKAQMDEAPGNGPRRPAATGNDGAVQTEF